MSEGKAAIEKSIVSNPDTDRECGYIRFFFFQAEDGIRDVAVTGVQTCALPIYLRSTDSRVGAVPPLRRPAARSWRFRCTQASWLSAWARSFCTVAHWRSNKFWL